ncbi:MAG: aldehyde ferredoxin oxidoreductase [Deltaproteobacteria bacterium]|nr:aldehyde ferredoxin oxidoreductase [Deltaproteobacteria bacterium]
MTILKLDMSKKQIVKEAFPKDKLVGGRAMIDDLLTQYGSPTAHPLAPEAPFIAAPGLLAGTAAPQSGRMSFGGKSPLTGGIKEANSGGTAGDKLGRLGIRAIMVQGKSDQWQVLKITGEETVLEPAGNIVGMENYGACEKLRQRYGEKISVIIIGPAGEMKLANSTVAVTDPEDRPARHAGRGGVGAVMGSKGLKAIVVDSSGVHLRKAANPDAFKQAVKTAAETIQNNPLRQVFNSLGTNVCIDGDGDRGSLPTRNHRHGAFEKRKGLCSNTLIELNNARGGSMGNACMPGCIVKCSPIFHDANGNHVTSALEYETIAMLGANLGIDDLDPVARMDRRCDELGLDTIEVGCAIGVLNDVGLFEFGDAAKAESYIEEIAQGTPMGRIIGSGVTQTAKVFGIDRIPAVKGQGIPAHSARSLKGWGVTYATSPQGADHTAGVVEDDPLNPAGQVERSRMAQIYTAALDATGLCMFTFLAGTPAIIADMVAALYGVPWTAADFEELGKEMLRQERAFNVKAGIGPEADGLPDWMRAEPLPPTGAVFDVPQEEIDQLFDF